MVDVREQNSDRLRKSALECKPNGYTVEAFGDH
jgi:hypothetical protein